MPYQMSSKERKDLSHSISVALMADYPLIHDGSTPLGPMTTLAGMFAVALAVPTYGGSVGAYVLFMTWISVCQRYSTEGVVEGYSCDLNCRSDVQIREDINNSVAETLAKGLIDGNLGKIGTNSEDTITIDKGIVINPYSILVEHHATHNRKILQNVINKVLEKCNDSVFDVCLENIRQNPVLQKIMKPCLNNLNLQALERLTKRSAGENIENNKQNLLLCIECLVGIIKQYKESKWFLSYDNERNNQILRLNSEISKINGTLKSLSDKSAYSDNHLVGIESYIALSNQLITAVADIASEIKSTDNSTLKKSLETFLNVANLNRGKESTQKSRELVAGVT